MNFIFYPKLQKQILLLLSLLCFSARCGGVKSSSKPPEPTGNTPPVDDTPPPPDDLGDGISKLKKVLQTEDKDCSSLRKVLKKHLDQIVRHLIDKNTYWSDPSVQKDFKLRSLALAALLIQSVKTQNSIGHTFGLFPRDRGELEEEKRKEFDECFISFIEEYLDQYRDDLSKGELEFFSNLIENLEAPTLLRDTLIKDWSKFAVYFSAMYWESDDENDVRKYFKLRSLSLAVRLIEDVKNQDESEVCHTLGFFLQERRGLEGEQREESVNLFTSFIEKYLSKYPTDASEEILKFFSGFIEKLGSRTWRISFAPSSTSGNALNMMPYGLGFVIKIECIYLGIHSAAQLIENVKSRNEEEACKTLKFFLQERRKKGREGLQKEGLAKLDGFFTSFIREYLSRYPSNASKEFFINFAEKLRSGDLKISFPPPYTSEMISYDWELVEKIENILTSNASSS